MPPVSNPDEETSDKTTKSDEKANGVNGNSEKPSSSQSDKVDKKDENTNEKAVNGAAEETPGKKAPAQDKYGQLETKMPTPTPPKVQPDKVTYLQEVKLNGINGVNGEANGNHEKKPAPAPDVYPTKLPSSPIKYAGPVTPVTKLKTVPLQETQKEAEKAKAEILEGRDIFPPDSKSKILEQVHTVIPVQQLDIRSIPGDHDYKSPGKVTQTPIPSKPAPPTSLYPKPVRLEPISRSESPTPVTRKPARSISPGRSSSKERAPIPSTERLTRKDLTPRKDLVNGKTTIINGKTSPKAQSIDSKLNELSKTNKISPKAISPKISPKDKRMVKQATPASQKSTKETPKVELFKVPQYESVPTPSPMTKNKPPSEFAVKLLALCRKQDWVGVDTIIKFAEKSGLNIENDLNIHDEKSGWTPLMFCVKDNRIQLVEQLLDLGFPVNSRAIDGITALHLACAFAREDTVRLLLTRKADPLIPGGPKQQLPIHVLAMKPTGAAVVPLQLILKSCPREVRLAPDGDGNIPLFLALEVQNHGVSKLLLSEIAREQCAVKRPDTGECAIHIALRKKDFDMLRLVIELGGNINSQNNDGQTALHMAAMSGEEQIIKYLHQAGASSAVRDNLERTPLHVATESSNQKAVDFLTEKFKASVHERTKDGSTLMHLAAASGHPGTAMVFMKRGVALHMPNKAGAKAIHMAASKGHTEVVRAIVQKGEDVDAKTNEGFTALHIAVQNGHAEVVEALLGMGAAVQLKAGKYNETPLHTAARIENGSRCVEMLIKSGAAINALEESDHTPLHLASKGGHLDSVNLLLEDGGNPQLQNNKGENSLHLCVRECHYAIAQAFIQHTINKGSKEEATKLVNQQDKMGESSVHYAANLLTKNTHYPNEDRDMMRLLLQNGGKFFLETVEKGENPIHYCSKSGNTNTLQEVIGQLQNVDAQIACNKQAKNGWPPLFYACYYGHADIVRMLLNQNARADVFDDRGQAALHIAAELGHDDVVDILLDNNAFVNVRNKHGMTPLHLASKKGFNTIVKQLVLEHGALLDAFTLTKQTPLHLAAENGQLEVCNTLISMKADLNATDNHSQTPLHLAAEHDHSAVLKLFLKHHPELLSVPNKNGYTCAHIAAAKGSVAVIKELMRLNQESVINARIPKTKSTTLHLAAEGGHVEVVRVLLKVGSKATDENAEGYTALHLAAKNGHVKVLGVLKEQSTAHWKVCSRRIGLTALHVAAAFGQADFVGEMLTQVPATIKSERPLIDPSGDYGITPLHLACQSGHENVVRLLLNSQGVTVDAPTDVVGTIPMHLAAQGGHLLVAGLLISRTTEQLYTADKYGRTPLHLAASYGHRDMVNLLLGQGALINTQDNRGWSPLHYAARHGFLEVVQLLTDSGADPTLRAKDGRVPLCCAAGAGYFQVLSFLFKKDHDALSLMEDKSFLLDLMVCSKQNDNKPIQEFILVSPAPIDTAVKLAKCYENLAVKEKDRTKDLVKACVYCDQIATDLLSIAATTNSAGRLLRAVDHKGTEFLDVLIELERKEVVAQHAVQQYLTNVWIGNLKWAGWKFIALFFGFIIMPIIWVVVSCPLGHSLCKIPIIKFMSYLVSHIFFIVLLTFTTVNPWVPLYLNEGSWPHWHEWLFLIWVMGVFISEMTNPADRAGLGGIKVVITGVCYIGVGLHILTVFLGYMEYVEEDTRLIMLYCRNQLLAVGLLLSFLEFLNFLTFHHLFGPWAVIIRDLIKDLLRFLAILGIFMVGFSLHVCAIYQPVFHPPDNINGTLPSLGQEFQSPIDTFEMLFYALFGLVEPDYMPPMHLSPYIAKVIMKLVFGIYMMVTVVVLINLLIAMMSNTYQRIQAQSDTEWKFGRAKLIRNMNRTSPTPSPINVFVYFPLLLGEKISKMKKEKKGLSMATAALAHRPSVVAAKQWMVRRASKSTSHMSRTLGPSMAEDGETHKPITEVVNWPSIVKKYLEFIGAIRSGEDEKEEKEGKTEEGDSGSENGA